MVNLACQFFADLEEANHVAAHEEPQEWPSISVHTRESLFRPEIAAIPGRDAAISTFSSSYVERGMPDQSERTIVL